MLRVRGHCLNTMPTNGYRYNHLRARTRGHSFQVTRNTNKRSPFMCISAPCHTYRPYLKEVKFMISSALKPSNANLWHIYCCKSLFLRTLQFMPYFYTSSRLFSSIYTGWLPFFNHLAHVKLLNMTLFTTENSHMFGSKFHVRCRQFSHRLESKIFRTCSPNNFYTL